MDVATLTTKMYERAANMGIQTNEGPDITAFRMKMFVDDINVSTAVDDTVRVDWLLEQAEIKFP